jgi:6-phosphogluconolactonase (cycloisomerase 2 family)
MMLHLLYVAAGDKIMSFARRSSADNEDAAGHGGGIMMGGLDHLATVVLPAAASCFCLSPDLRFLYCSTTVGFVTMGVCQHSGALTQLDVVKSLSTEDRPCFCTTDHTGRFLLASYYTASSCSVHSIGVDGHVAVEKQYIELRSNAHFIGVDSSNRFAYVPCVAAINSTGILMYVQSLCC